MLFLIASGLTLVFGAMRTVTIAHGSFYMLGVYVAWTVITRTQSLPHKGLFNLCGSLWRNRVSGLRGYYRAGGVHPAGARSVVTSRLSRFSFVAVISPVNMTGGTGFFSR